MKTSMNITVVKSNRKVLVDTAKEYGLKRVPYRGYEMNRHSATLRFEVPEGFDASAFEWELNKRLRPTRALVWSDTEVYVP